MNVAITAKDETLDAEMDPHFGRARKFILVDTGTGRFTAHDNAQNLNAAQGAGIQSAQTVSRLGAEALISGHVGPKAFLVLREAGVRVFLAPPGTVAGTLEALKAGALKEAMMPDVESHWA